MWSPSICESQLLHYDKSRRNVTSLEVLWPQGPHFWRCFTGMPMIHSTGHSKGQLTSRIGTYFVCILDAFWGLRMSGNLLQRYNCFIYNNQLLLSASIFLAEFSISFEMDGCNHITSHSFTLYHIHFFNFWITESTLLSSWVEFKTTIVTFSRSLLAEWNKQSNYEYYEKI